MKNLIVCFLFVLFATVNASAQDYFNDADGNTSAGREDHFNRQYPTRDQLQIMEPYRHNGYGLGVHQDRSGRAFQFRDDRGRVNDIEDIQQDSFGEYRNQFGERVRPHKYGRE